MKKRRISILLIGIMIISSLVGCNTSDSDNSNNDDNSNGSKESLSVYIFAQEHEQDMYKEVIEKFEEDNNVTVDFEVAGDQYWTELEAALTAGTEPDVFYLNVADVKKRVWADKVTPINELISEDSISEIWPEALNLYRYDKENDVLGEGNIYALPKDFSAVAMTVNKAILNKRENEIQELVDDGTLPFYPEIDEDGNLPVYTFDEFAQLCKVLTFDDQTLPETAGDTQVYGTHLWEEFTLQPFVWGAGGSYLNDEHDEVLFNSPEFIEGYEGFMEIVDQGGSGLSTDETTGYLKFLNGRVAYFPCGTWDVGAFQAIEDDEEVNPNKEWFDYDLAPWPISNDYADAPIEERQDKWFGRIDSVGYAVSNSSDNKELAAKLAYVLSADEEVQRFLAQNGGQVPNITSLAETEYVEDDENYYPENRQIFLDILSVKNGHRIETSYTFNDVWHIEGFISGVDNVWSYYEGIDKGVEPMSVEEYCNTIQDEAQMLLDQAIEDEKAIKPDDIG